VPTIHLIRHAQASFGTADYDVLSEVGRQQCAALGESLRERGVGADVVVRGSMRRQQETLELCRVDGGSPVAVDPRLDEYDHADIFEHYAPDAVAIWRGDQEAARRFSPAEVQALLDRALRQWAIDGDDGPCRETWPAFQARALAAVVDLAEALGRGQEALAFTSAGVTAAIGAHLLRAGADAFVALNRVAVNTGVTKLAHGRTGTSLVSFNDHSHLEGKDRTLLTYR
jgi:broad specificity phosphatase PhoE